MPSKKIPCQDCEEETDIIEATGRYEVVSCEPIPGEDGWCRIEWVRRERNQDADSG